MVGKMVSSIGAVAFTTLVMAGCAEAPSIPHRSQGLEAVDCLACHQLGLKGATKIPENHVDDQGNVRHDNCDCHEPAPPEEQTPWNGRSHQTRVAEAAGFVLASAGLGAFGVGMARGGLRE